MHPAVAFCEAVTKRASKDGWKLKLSMDGFLWKKDDKTIGAQINTLDASLQLHNACVLLDKQQYNLIVTL
jgi:hypothetical protein